MSVEILHNYPQPVHRRPRCTLAQDSRGSPLLVSWLQDVNGPPRSSHIHPALETKYVVMPVLTPLLGNPMLGFVEGKKGARVLHVSVPHVALLMSSLEERKTRPHSALNFSPWHRLVCRLRKFPLCPRIQQKRKEKREPCTPNSQKASNNWGGPVRRWHKHS